MKMLMPFELHITYMYHAILLKLKNVQIKNVSFLVFSVSKQIS